MDIVLHDVWPSEAERAAVDAVLGPPGSSSERGIGGEPDQHAAHGGHLARAQRHLLLPVLHAVQAQSGWITPGALNYICERLTIPPADAYGVATFYAMFSLEPQAPAVAHVCTDGACLARGGSELCAELESRLGPAGGHKANGNAIWLESPCLGACERAPAALVTLAGDEPREQSVAPARPEDVLATLAGKEAPTPPPPSVPQAGDPSLRLLRRIGQVKPQDIDSYRQHDGYQALRAAFELGPAGVLREVTDSQLLGRGGAAFPTGRKWEA